MVALFLLFPFGRILAAAISIYSLFYLSLNKKPIYYYIGLITILYYLAIIVIPNDSYIFLLLSGLILVPNKRRTLFIYRTWAFVSVIELMISIVLLGKIDFYGNYFDLQTMKLSQSVADSNLAGLFLLGLFGLTTSRIEKVVLFVIILAVGLSTGSRTFLIAVGLFASIIVIKSGIKTFTSMLLLYFFLFKDLLVFLPERGLESSRFIAWEMALSDYGLFGLSKLESTEDYYVSAFHNGILDAYFLYGPVIGTVLQVFFIIFIFLNFHFRAFNIIVLIYCIIVYLTSVVWRGDTVFFLIAYNLLSSDFRYFKLR